MAKTTFTVNNLNPDFEFPDGVCKFDYINPGSCKWGNNCQYEHGVIPLDDLGILKFDVEKEEICRYNWDSRAGCTRRGCWHRHLRLDARGREECRYNYLQPGRCPFGDICSYTHIAPPGEQ